MSWNTLNYKLYILTNYIMCSNIKVGHSWAWLKSYEIWIFNFWTYRTGVWLTDQNRYLSHLLISPNTEHTTSSNTQRTQSGFDCWLSGDNLSPWSIYIGHTNPDRFSVFSSGDLIILFEQARRRSNTFDLFVRKLIHIHRFYPRSL